MEYELLKVFDISSFTNIWYWVFLAVAWSRTTYFTLGVPLHEARFAAQRGESYMQEFETQIAIAVDRHVEIFSRYGAPMIAIVSFLLATIGTLGFAFGMELMQALFLLLCPLALANAFSMAYALRQDREKLRDLDLYYTFTAHRRYKQIFGALTIIVIAAWAALRISQNQYI